MSKGLTNRPMGSSVIGHNTGSYLTSVRSLLVTFVFESPNFTAHEVHGFVNSKSFLEEILLYVLIKPYLKKSGQALLQKNNKNRNKKTKQKLKGNKRIKHCKQKRKILKDK